MERIQKTIKMNVSSPNWKSGLSSFGMLSLYFDRPRFDAVSVLGFLAGWLSFFTLFLAFNSSARTVVAGTIQVGDENDPKSFFTTQ
jgi:hypothetical protein